MKSKAMLQISFMVFFLFALILNELNCIKANSRSSLKKIDDLTNQAKNNNHSHKINHNTFKVHPLDKEEHHGINKEHQSKHGNKHSGGHYQIENENQMNLKNSLNTSNNYEHNGHGIHHEKINQVNNIHNESSVHSNNSGVNENHTQNQHHYNNASHHDNITTHNQSQNQISKSYSKSTSLQQCLSS